MACLNGPGEPIVDEARLGPRPKVAVTARALLMQITAQGYRGGYTQVTDFIRAWRNESGLGSKAFVPLSFENGEAFQFDWSEEGMLVGGIFRKVQVSHMKLCASRAFWLVAYPTQTHEMLFDAQGVSIQPAPTVEGSNPSVATSDIKGLAFTRG